MKISIENTDKIVDLIVNGEKIPARIWEGTTEDNIPVHCFITRLVPTIPEDDPRQKQFFLELTEQPKPASEEIQAYDARLIL